MAVTLSQEIARLTSEFRAYLETEEARKHLEYLQEREPKETRDIFKQLKNLERGGNQFTELVLYGLLPQGKSKFAKRLSTAPAFLNIKQFFSKFHYNETDWKEIAKAVFSLVEKYDKQPASLGDAIQEFTKSRYSKGLQCGSISPVLYALNRAYPIVNNRVIKTYKTLSISVLGRKGELTQKLEGYLGNTEKIREFVKVLSEDYDLRAIEDLAVFDLFCYWFDEHYRKEDVVPGAPPRVRRVRKQREEAESREKDDLFEDTEEEQALELAPEAKRVIWQPKDYSIRELAEMHRDGELSLQPKFQRYFLWDNTKSSRLIESIFLDVPIPVIYLSEEQDGKYTVIDGQQRLTSFFKFYDGTLTLKGLLVLSDLNNSKYPGISQDLKSKFKKATIHTIVIKKESQEDIRFEIFERLNTGSVKLNDQELRNCIYRGEYNELLEELSQDKEFLFLLGLKEPHKRMIDRELILRFFTFHGRTYLKYESPMKGFLNRDMDANRNLAGRGQREELRGVFKKSVELTKYVFAGNAFRRFICGDSSDPNGVWETRRVNKALFDVVMYGFVDYEKRQIVPRSDAVREELIWLMTHDAEFIDAITISTNDKAKILTRFEKWLRALREVLGYPERGERGFSTSLKRGLFDSDGSCAICRQQIRVLDDAEVDHLEFYWRGGKTIPSNARLTHRFCNRSRGGR